MTRTVERIDGERFWLTAKHDGPDRRVRILQASTGKAWPFSVYGELSESEARAEAWSLFLEGREE